MPLPDNTAAMMAGEGPFGSVEMGGMFTVLKVRRGQKRGDYSNLGWFKHPPGTVAYEFKGTLPPPPSSNSPGGAAAAPAGRPRKDVEVQIRKPPSGHGHH